MNYAIVNNGTVENVIVWDGDGDLGLAEGTSAHQIADGISVGIGYLFDGVNFTAPAPDVVPLQWTAYQANAKAALDQSDVTVLRCVENGIAVPVEWAAYRKSLRAIVSAGSGDATQALPAKPAYPAGT